MKIPLGGCVAYKRHKHFAVLRFAAGVVFRQIYSVSCLTSEKSPKAHRLSSFTGSSYEIATIVSVLLPSYSRQRSGDHGQERYAADFVIHTRHLGLANVDHRNKQHFKSNWAFAQGYA